MDQHEKVNTAISSQITQEHTLTSSVSCPEQQQQQQEMSQHGIDQDTVMVEQEESTNATITLQNTIPDPTIAELDSTEPTSTEPMIIAVESATDYAEPILESAELMNEPMDNANNTNTEPVATEEATDGYAATVFVHDFSIPCTLISSTQDRYNTVVKETLEAEAHLLQQKPVASNMHNANNFFRNVKWSPDGMCLLTNSNDDVVRLFNLPSNAYDEIPTDSSPQPLDMAPALCVREGESVYDFEWFPAMSSQDPATWCFLTSVRDHPVRLWDVSTGTVRASYSVIDHQERFIGPNVVRFNLDGSKIYCGYNNMIEVFDTQRPGQDSQKIPTVPRRRSRKGQKGLISCLDFSPDYSGLYAAGSYSQSVGIYDESNNELCLKLTGIEGGVTQVRFSLDGSLLFTASRQANSILCWDIRNTANVLYEIPRLGKTNQRISFDIDASGTTLVTADQNGRVLFYDIKSGENDDEQKKDRCLSSFEAHRDIATCATFNPTVPLIATTSGQRKYSNADSSGSEDDTMESDIVDNSLKIWRIHGQYSWYSYET
ncbi:Telomerase Cajal body protein 1 [Apophysomyces sp. BC1034]|nr:Telomerase Cajal body protein 1 [Apophysomyces sp. BC1015]KAG0176010.1 Telomerase Cajal body protein 1 [Apophysomyces sp. BC1021]KAG0189960.1 Telomerase Cajal body protein 1 [Apophysomyces sp. BC1034]